MSKRGWRWFDRLFIFGALSVAFAVVVNTTREYLMEKGYLLPDEQKKHLTGGAAHVRKKFDNAKITPPTQDIVNQINRADTASRKMNTPVQAPKRRSFSEQVGDPLVRGGKSSPLGNPLTNNNGFVKPEISLERADEDRGGIPPVITSKNVITPSQKERVAPVVSSPKVPSVAPLKKTKSTLPAICENGFVIDLKTQTGETRRFYFNMSPTTQMSSMKVSVLEYSGSISEIGGNVKLNVMYYNPSRVANGGKAFSVIFNHKKGFLVAPYDPSLTQTVCIADGDRITLSYNQRTKNVSISSEQLSVPQDVKKVNESVRYVSVKNVIVPQRAVQLRKNRKVSIVHPNAIHER